MSGRTGQGWARCLPRVFAALAAGVGLYGAALVVAVPGLARGPASVADIAEGLQDAVVNISTTQTLKGPDDGAPIRKGPKGSPFEEFFDDFFDEEGPDGMPRKVSSLGSGFVIDPSGLIVTNNHVIEGADEIIVNFNDGSKLKVTKILGHDPKTDLALLKVEPSRPLKAVSFGDSSALRVGDWVMAIGNPFGLGGSVTVGVVSATKRDINAGPYDDFIQTDAAINRGNSGGPLFNMEGEVVGVNTAYYTGGLAKGGFIGIGYSIPSLLAKEAAGLIRKYGYLKLGWIGVGAQAVTPQIAEALTLKTTRGAIVASVDPKGPANGQLQTGDVITHVGKSSIRDPRALYRATAPALGQPLTVEYLRDGHMRTATLTPVEWPGEEPPPGKVDDLLG